MRKFGLLLSVVAVLSPVSPVFAAPVGSDAVACESGKPSIEVVVSGFKQASGTLKVTLYNGDPARYLVHNGKLRNVVVPVRSAGPMDVCIAVPAPGLYAVAIFHDVSGDNQKDRGDGGGYSRNPKLSIFNLKPGFNQTGFRVGNGPVRTSITLLYARGLSIGPVKS